MIEVESNSFYAANRSGRRAARSLTCSRDQRRGHAESCPASGIVGIMPRLFLRRASRTARWRQHRAGRPVRLMPISLALCVVVLLAGAAAVGLVTLALSGLGRVDLSAIKPTVTEVLENVKISLAVLAGIGGLVALVVAYRRQRITEAGENREQAKLYAERFDKASDKLGHDSAAVRLAGVHALASLADDWAGGRQMCIDVLYAYLRMHPDPEPDATAHIGGRAMGEVRATILRLIGIHLKDTAPVPWHGADLDFTGVTFTTDLDFTDAVLSGGHVRFTGAKFAGGHVRFVRAKFAGSLVFFDGAEFSGGEVDFSEAEFSGGQATFADAEFSGGTVDLSGAKFTGGAVWFFATKFSGGTVTLAAPSSPAPSSGFPKRNSPAVRSISARRSSPVARSGSARPSSPSARSASPTRRCPAAGSRSGRRSSRAPRSTSPARSSPAARSTPPRRASPAARWTSAERTFPEST
ncbi:pentapeptide repeat-containing protein [Nonomuraea turkmeniaca]|uniref:Pentapeptide repeat-containing protein n=1 Tax=Nonomuraea turkmeniaca TaxID=103838 RepID=A0A5S4F5H5_9ACTN|nr:pentapeptide repeat-containing protein [Nonomuraea turkmeniaca]TMR11311.1 pentapeptide repeat-containing protein [Nonomuraea turkmeniaca]